MSRQEAEAVTRLIYGETFSRYSPEEFLEFIEPLELRLAANGIALEVFQGKRCLDAGCGGGRASVLMARAGAAEVVAFDFADENIQTTARNAALFNLGNIKVECGSLLSVPFPDESFDIVWCNGVLHHTTDPDKALREVVRVLKSGGQFWLYLYGSGGLYWYMVDFFREWLQDIGILQTIACLALLDTPRTRIAEFIDDWFVPNLKRYTHKDVASRLAELGLGNVRQLCEGMPYDTSVRRSNEGEQVWMGEGDLRYWAEKTAPAQASQAHRLPDFLGKGSHYLESQEVMSFRLEFEALSNSSAAFGMQYPALQQMARVTVAARLQTWLRNAFSHPDPFDADAFRALIRQQIELIQSTIPDL